MATQANALDLEAGVALTHNSFYHEPDFEYPDGREFDGVYKSGNSHTIGYIRLSHDFHITEKLALSVFGEHLSILNPSIDERDDLGKNFIGTGLKYKIF